MFLLYRQSPLVSDVTYAQDLGARFFDTRLTLNHFVVSFSVFSLSCITLVDYRPVHDGVQRHHLHDRAGVHGQGLPRHVSFVVISAAAASARTHASRGPWKTLCCLLHVSDTSLTCCPSLCIAPDILCVVQLADLCERPRGRDAQCASARGRSIAAE